jgi:hypothetical protein
MATAAAEPPRRAPPAVEGVLGLPSFLQIVLFLLMMNLPYNNPAFLMLVRGAYALMAFLRYAAHAEVLRKVQLRQESEKEAAGTGGDVGTKVWLRRAQGGGLMSMIGFGGDDSESVGWEEWTLGEVDAALSQKVVDEVLTSSLMQLGLSFTMNMHVPLLLSAVRTPLDLLDSASVWRHVLGARVEKPFGGLPAPPAGALVVVPGGGGAGALDGRIEAVWNAEESPESVVAGLSDKEVTEGTNAEGWTWLMVVAGHERARAEDVEALLKKGAQLERCDHDGWNAVHWAAFHGNDAALAVLRRAAPELFATARTSGPSGNLAGKTAEELRNVGVDDDRDDSADQEAEQEEAAEDQEKEKGEEETS